MTCDFNLVAVSIIFLNDIFSSFLSFSIVTGFSNANLLCILQCLKCLCVNFLFSFCFINLS